MAQTMRVWRRKGNTLRNREAVIAVDAFPSGDIEVRVLAATMPPTLNLAEVRDLIQILADQSQKAALLRLERDGELV